ncbi:AmmeMemoRadiSam system protein B [Tissierella sp. Yu-01]|uniref:AmmeMemoRadiSam system protein B n=1 Tax=Tissierella sp. Yu-01 TaxID=3035694 RepID=UPI00240DBE54|nr:AmmeMemoRadiSam system protein B [Tissierella sp. Yu-01]WFA08481.1 AmmeMemoRadiSam system protein B [Tissierella sp. Yu-01]
MGKILGSYLFPHPPIIIEDIGQGQEKKAGKTIEGVKSLARSIRDKAPNTIIVITPHGPLFTDAISITIEEDLKGDFRKFGYWDIKLECKNDVNLAYRIIRNALSEGIQIAQVNMEFAKINDVELDLDHGTIVPLYYVDKEYKDYKIVHIICGFLSPTELYDFGIGIKSAVEEVEGDAVILISGDLSHKLSDDDPYCFSPCGEEFDKKIIEILKSGDMESLVAFDLELAERADECGLRPLMIMAGALDKAKLNTEVLSHESPYGIGYCTAKLEVID